MGDYRVDLSGLQQLIDATAALENAIEEQVTAIEQRVEALHVNWSGAAAAGHLAAHEARVAGVAAMRTALGELRGKLRTARDSYIAVGETNLGMWP
ncbi:WXG100 family type VII secretion target [Nocardia sp. NBC_01503]|uniref:WXG100 family type VII secretion target n=1 Tax=Nocardia sp. NBC_01503 TaxID=2975997 RepID=UPI002E7AE146|nr:WXG100 family type VII secretion target [Nocardia sp. NBC_01503]WTL32714.1 WXG100 family type VII secretion target [Nocardia sp. NBC_01503]